MPPNKISTDYSDDSQSQSTNQGRTDGYYGSFKIQGKNTCFFPPFTEVEKAGVVAPCGSGLDTDSKLTSLTFDNLADKLIDLMIDDMQGMIAPQKGALQVKRLKQWISYLKRQGKRDILLPAIANALRVNKGLLQKTRQDFEEEVDRLDKTGGKADEKTTELRKFFCIHGSCKLPKFMVHRAVMIVCEFITSSSGSQFAIDTNANHVVRKLMQPVVICQKTFSTDRQQEDEFLSEEEYALLLQEEAAPPLTEADALLLQEEAAPPLTEADAPLLTQEDAPLGFAYVNCILGAISARLWDIFISLHNKYCPRMTTARVNLVKGHCNVHFIENRGAVGSEQKVDLADINFDFGKTHRYQYPKTTYKVSSETPPGAKPTHTGRARGTPRANTTQLNYEYKSYEPAWKPGALTDYIMGPALLHLVDLMAMSSDELYLLWACPATRRMIVDLGPLLDEMVHRFDGLTKYFSTKFDNLQSFQAGNYAYLFPGEQRKSNYFGVRKESNIKEMSKELAAHTGAIMQYLKDESIGAYWGDYLNAMKPDFIHTEALQSMARSIKDNTAIRNVLWRTFHSNAGIQKVTEFRRYRFASYKKGDRERTRFERRTSVSGASPLELWNGTKTGTMVQYDKYTNVRPLPSESSSDQPASGEKKPDGKGAGPSNAGTSTPTTTTPDQMWYNQLPHLVLS